MRCTGIPFSEDTATMHSHKTEQPRQNLRRLFQGAFFLFFIFAPVFDILRYDLNQDHLILFGSPWTLGIDAVIAGESTPLQAALDIILRGFLPIILILFAFGWTSWKYGRLYCGWLCPHFSVVEMINNLMRKTIGKHSIWDRKLSNHAVDGSEISTDRRFAWLVAVAVIGFAFLWAVVLLTYLLPPAEIYLNLVQLSLTRNQMLFIAVATLLLSIEFAFARHLFCRFGCAVGVFQSLVWMANKRAMVVSFERSKATHCQECHNACDEVCPMRLKPRSIKRSMFTCTECAQCLDTCAQVQDLHGRKSLLTWKDGQSALEKSNR